MFVVNHKGFVGNKISPGKICCHGRYFIQLFFQVKVFSFLSLWVCKDIFFIG